MKRFRHIFCPRCLRANRDTPGDEEHSARGLSDSVPVDTGSSIDDDKLQNLQKQLDLEMRVKEGAENLILAYSQGPITNQKILKNVQQMHEDCMKKIQVLSMQIQRAKKKTPPDNALDEVPEIENAAPELDESPEKDMEVILESILEQVFQLVPDRMPIPALQEAPEMDNIIVSGPELDESPQKNTEAIVEHILECVFQLVTDSVPIPAQFEALGMDNIMVSGLEPDESSKKDTEAIVKILLERVILIVTDTESYPALDKASEIDNTMVSGHELDESPEKDTKAILEIILERVYQLVTDTEFTPAPDEASEMEIDCVSLSQVDKQFQDLPSSGCQSPICVMDLNEEQEVHPAPPETPKQRPEMESPRKDIEAIEESILEQDFEMVIDASSVPALAEAPEEIENVSGEEVDKQIQDLPSSGIQSQCKISLEDFRCCAVLGKGSFGKVLLAEHKKSGQMVALKALKKARLIAKRSVHRLMSEKETFVTISSARNPFLVNLIASFQTETHAIFAMEYAAGGDLEMHLNNTTEGFPKPRAVFYAACVILGVECLHRHNIVHRDLKAENIVLDQEGFAKITDFGLCKPGMGFGDRTVSTCGTLPYLAPEILTDHSYTRAVDWWSVGALIYAMLVGRTPYTGNTDREIINKILHAPVTFPKNLSKKGTALLRLLLDKNPTLRLGASEKDAAEVKEHRFFRRINWTKLLDRKMTPPFLPSITDQEDVSNFSSRITSRAPVLTPPRGASLTEEDQDAFVDFDWIAE